MAFFDRTHMIAAKSTSLPKLQRQYHAAERALKRGARRGASDERMSELMAEHQRAEYNLLAKRRLIHRQKTAKRGKRT